MEYKFFNELEEKIKLYYNKVEDPSHDFSHVIRVYNLAIRLQEKEGGDIDIIKVAALLHDLHHLSFKRDKTFVLGKEILNEIEEILHEINFPKEKISAVLHCIEVHDDYSFTKQGNRAKTIEAKIIQDADNLDGFGAIGVARTFVFGGKHQRPMWDGKLINNQFYENEKINESSIQHFYDKLLKLKSEMNTKTAIQMAEVRHNFTKIFLDQFMKEWNGEL